MNPPHCLIPSRLARRYSAGVTVLEWIMLLVLIVGLGALLASGAMRAPMMEKAQQTRTELEEVERAMVVLAGENGWEDGMVVTFDQLLIEIRPKFKRLRESANDPLGNAYGPQVVGTLPGVPVTSFDEFSPVVPDGYWEPYGSTAESRDAVLRDY